MPEDWPSETGLLGLSAFAFFAGLSSDCSESAEFDFSVARIESIFFGSSTFGGRPPLRFCERCHNQGHVNELVPERILLVQQSQDCSLWLLAREMRSFQNACRLSRRSS